MVRPVPLDMELNVTSAEHSGSESATEDNATDKEDESKSQREEMKCERAVTPGDVSPACKRLSPKPGKNIGSLIFTEGAELHILHKPRSWYPSSADYNN